uniref:Uncharacterized protein n=1 Tax=Arundo donax TaxID=35708 RepID=A0A0A9F5F0_ARUDO
MKSRSSCGHTYSGAGGARNWVRTSR